MRYNAGLNKVRQTVTLTNDRYGFRLTSVTPFNAHDRSVLMPISPTTIAHLPSFRYVANAFDADRDECIFCRNAEQVDLWAPDGREKVGCIPEKIGAIVVIGEVPVSGVIEAF